MINLIYKKGFRNHLGATSEAATDVATAVATAVATGGDDVY